MLKHIGLTINNKSDIQFFYRDLLRLEEVRQFDLYQDLSEQLFDISATPSVTLLANDTMTIELFLSDIKQEPVYNHVCLAIPDREQIINQARAAGFPVIIVTRESRDDLVFIKDSSGNTFEIVEDRDFKKA